MRPFQSSRETAAAFDVSATTRVGIRRCYAKPTGRSEQLAHPGGGTQRAAEAVKVYADYVARLAVARIARDGDEVVPRIGVGDELGDARAEVVHRAQRSAHAATLRVAQQRSRI